MCTGVFGRSEGGAEAPPLRLLASDVDLHRLAACGATAKQYGAESGVDLDDGVDAHGLRLPVCGGPKPPVFVCV
jgi:hypothetical protein